MRYDAVVFDLLTALLDSWTLWNAVARSQPDGLRGRRRYLEITYGCGAYRPYETLVCEAARHVGLPEGLGRGLERRWAELQPWPEALAVLRQIGLPFAVATNCSIRLGHQAAARVGMPFALVETAESVGFYKPRPEVYWTVLHKLGTEPRRTLCVDGSPADVPGARAVGMPVYWQTGIRLAPRDNTHPIIWKPLSNSC